MDVVHGDFVWNSHKERANVLKHGVDFRVASLVFLDPDIRIFVDDGHSITEQRHFAIGKVNGRVLTVRFVYRGINIRIIGAGYWRKGRGHYEKKKI
jgi:uncharacterized DUF497 family protein